jgi:hypothetical protein
MIATNISADPCGISVAIMERRGAPAARSQPRTVSRAPTMAGPGGMHRR